MTIQRQIGVAAAVGGLLIAASALAQRPSASPADRERIEGFLSQRQGVDLQPPIADGFEPIVVVERFEPITNAPIIPGRKVEAQVTDGELVLGVVLNGEARAYPINMLTGPEREIINDTLGGRPIAATWCHLCNNAVVYDRELDGRRLTLGVSGMLWRRNLVMYDVETESLWAHLNGKAMQGELIGAELEMLPGTLTTWGEWSARHPETTVLDMSRTATAYEAGVFEDAERYTFGWNLLGYGAYHIGIDELAEAPVRNVSAGGMPLLVSFEPATSRVVLASRRAEGRTLSFARRPDGRLEDGETGSVWDPIGMEAVSGPLAGTRLTQLAGMFAFRDAWLEFHPDSEPIE